MNCPARGDLSLLGAVPAGRVMGAGDELDGDPVLVHITVCRRHLPAVRRWLKTRTPIPDEVLTVGTEFLMREWHQMVDPIDLPVYGFTRTA